MGGSGLGFGVGGYAGARLGQPNGLVPCWAERPRGGGGGLLRFFCYVLFLFYRSFYLFPCFYFLLLI